MQSIGLREPSRASASLLSPTSMDDGPRPVRIRCASFPVSVLSDRFGSESCAAGRSTSMGHSPDPSPPREELARIVDIQTANLRRRLADRGLSLTISTAAKAALADEGFDPQFGARPLKRVIQQRLENAIATRLLGGDFLPGDTIEVDYEGKSFTFRRAGGGRAHGEVVEAELVEE